MTKRQKSTVHMLYNKVKERVAEREDTREEDVADEITQFLADHKIKYEHIMIVKQNPSEKVFIFTIEEGDKVIQSCLYCRIQHYDRAFVDALVLLSKEANADEFSLVGRVHSIDKSKKRLELRARTLVSHSDEIKSALYHQNAIVNYFREMNKKYGL